MNDTLEVGEAHPLAHDAFNYVKRVILLRPDRIEAIASVALSGNRSAEICFGTLDRIRNNEPISDRYLLGLAWMLKKLEKDEVCQ